jgi:protein-S-isoprenylcysteine O-methyltransferase Ste14
MSRVPALGPRGEGWVALQIGALLLVALGDRFGPRIAVDDPGLHSLAIGIGSIFVVVGLLFVLLGIAVLRGGGSFTVLPRPVARGQLVDSGPYRLVRHPVYTGLILASGGSGLMRLSLLTLVAAGLLFVILDLKRRREESWLLERYEGYAAYRTGTKALIPWVY